MVRRMFALLVLLAVPACSSDSNAVTESPSSSPTSAPGSRSVPACDDLDVTRIADALGVEPAGGTPTQPEPGVSICPIGQDAIITLTESAGDAAASALLEAAPGTPVDGIADAATLTEDGTSLVARAGSLVIAIESPASSQDGLVEAFAAVAERL